MNPDHDGPYIERRKPVWDFIKDFGQLIWLVGAALFGLVVWLASLHIAVAANSSDLHDIKVDRAATITEWRGWRDSMEARTAADERLAAEDHTDIRWLRKWAERQDKK